MNVTAFYALLTGMILGGIFALLDLPIPAPPAIEGVLGVVGIYLGYRLIEWIAATGFVQ